MESRCPHCGQPIIASSSARSRLRELLGRDDPRGEPLYVYRTADGGGWAVTYTRGERFSDGVVQGLANVGELVPVYPGMPGEHDAYGRAAHFGSDWYRRKIATALAPRKRPRP